MTAKYAAALSEHPSAPEAAGEIISHMQNALDGAPTLAVLFASVSHRDFMGEITESVMNFLAPQCLLATLSDTVIGGGREVESQPALALWGTTEGHAQGVRLTGGTSRELRGGDPTHPGSVSERELPPAATLLLLADPFSFPTEDLLGNIAQDQPDLRVVGGLTTAVTRPGSAQLWLNGELYSDGAIGALVSEIPGVRSVVSQGCHPIGSPYTVTKAEGNRLIELGGRPALMRLRDLVATASDEERRLMRKGLHVGIAVDESHLEYTGGDFLIRGIVDLDREGGAVAVGGLVEVGDTIQFHVRDAETASADLRSAFTDETAKGAKGALLFTCNGRGTHMFGTPHHDAMLISDTLGDLPMAGMSCAGEIGPVGRQSYLHGFTASVALFGGETGGDLFDDLGEKTDSEASREAGSDPDSETDSEASSVAERDPDSETDSEN